MLVAGSMRHFCGREVHEEKVINISLLGQKPQPTLLLLSRTGVVQGEAGGSAQEGLPAPGSCWDGRTSLCRQGPCQRPGSGAGPGGGL